MFEGVNGTPFCMSEQTLSRNVVASFARGGGGVLALPLVSTSSNRIYTLYTYLINIYISIYIYIYIYIVVMLQEGLHLHCVKCLPLFLHSLCS